MSDLKITDMYIKAGDCKYVTGNKRAAKKAMMAINPVKAQPAKLDDKGNILQKAVPEIKAIPARPAVPASQEMWIWAASPKILKEIEARMTDAGVFPVPGVELIDKLEVNYIFRGFDVSKKIGQCYSAENRQIFQDAFKKVKSKDFYNKAGAAILKADKAEKQRKKDEAAKEKAAKAAEKEKKDGGDKHDDKPAAKKPAKKLAKSTKKEDSDDWGE